MRIAKKKYGCGEDTKTSGCGIEEEKNRNTKLRWQSESRKKFGFTDSR